MPAFEFMFVADAIDESLEQTLAEEFDAFVGGHGNTTLVTIASDGVDAVSAAQSIVIQLRAAGVRVRRAYDDLVTRAQIADRANVTRQAVGMWARGERHSTLPFPEPFVLTAGGLWRWDEVNMWLRKAGLPHDEVEYPTAQDSAQINNWLCVRTSRVDLVFGGAGGVNVSVAHSTATTHPRADRISPWMNPADSKRTDFALGA